MRPGPDKCLSLRFSWLWLLSFQIWQPDLVTNHPELGTSAGYPFERPDDPPGQKGAAKVRPGSVATLACK